MTTARRRTLTAVILMLGTGILCAWLVRVTLGEGQELLGSTPRQLGAGQVDDLASVALLAVGAGVAAWYAGTCALALAVQAGRVVGTRTDQLEHALRRWGFPVLRRTLLTTAAVGMGAALSVGPAGAVAAGGEAPVPVDLGWGATTVDRAPEPMPEPTPPGTPTSTPSPSATPGPVTTTRPPKPPAPTPSVPADAAATPTPAAPTPTDPTPAAPAPVSATEPLPPPPPADDTETPRAGGTVADVAGAAGAGDASHETYTVRPGDTLWSITAAHLGPTATDAQVAASWPEWHRTNRALVGADPNLIHPGQQLLAPTEEKS